MGEYGYAYRSISTYSTIRNGIREPAVIKPFVPFNPKSNNGSNYSEGAVNSKKIVPVTGRPYDEPATEKYPSSEDEFDDDERRRQLSPVHSSPRKVDVQFPAKVQQNHEGSHDPQRYGPIVDRGRHTPQPSADGRKPIGGSTVNNHNDSYGTNYPYGGDRDGRKPIGISPIKNRKYGGGPNGYGGAHRATAIGDPSPHKDRRKPIGGGNLRSTHDGYHDNGYGGDKGHKPIGISPTRSNNYDGPNGFGGDHRATSVGDPNPYQEGRKPIGGGNLRSTHDGYHDNGYGGDKEGRKPVGISPTGNSNYDGPNRYSGDHRATSVGDPNPYKEGRKPIGVVSLKSTHDGYNNGKGYGGDTEVRKPIGIGSNIKNDNYDGPHRYGGDHRAAAVGDPNPYKEGRKPIGVGSIRSTQDGYDSPNGYGSDYNKKEGYKPTRNGNYGNGYGISNHNDKPFVSSSNPKYDDGDNAANYYNNRSNFNGPKINSYWTAAPRKGTQLSEPIHDIDKAMELLKMEAAKRDQQHSPTPGNASPRFTDRTGSGAAMRPYGNVNQLQSRPRDSQTRVTFIDDASDYDDDYYRRDDRGRYGFHDAVIDSREAEKKFKGTRV
ncbi:hypothetical protein MtrunA17_Chr1g0191211 [Medicago truncatula]|uniref:Uncharacterized protein n=1 Tax=Medicago truncatula TaxID=3880 RepID=A0A396JR11_MEDTR|nr:hypothetical protein MtrunA17_Chr1g0191211 [Medicago truncatula]